MMWNNGYGMGWGWFGGLHVLWWVLLVMGVFAVFRLLDRRRGDADGGGDRARAILRERYARGEIDKAEYDERMGHLGT